MTYREALHETLSFLEDHPQIRFESGDDFLTVYGTEGGFDIHIKIKEGLFQLNCLNWVEEGVLPETVFEFLLWALSKQARLKQTLRDSRCIRTSLENNVGEDWVEVFGSGKLDLNPFGRQVTILQNRYFETIPAVQKRKR